MYNRLIKLGTWRKYLEWIKENNYSILSPRHRGFYAEMVFNKYCKEKGITAIKINQYFDVSEQIPEYFLKKIQQKELKKLAKICLDFFCYEENSGYFVAVKMGTGNLSIPQKRDVNALKRIKVFLFRVYEDAEILIKQLNKEMEDRKEKD